LPSAVNVMLKLSNVSDFRRFLLGKELEPVKAARDLGVTLDSSPVPELSFLPAPYRG